MRIVSSCRENGPLALRHSHMPSGYWPLAAPYLTFAFHSHGQVQQTTDTRGMDIMACDKIRGSTERFLAPETWLRWGGHDAKVDEDEEEPEDTDRSGTTSEVNNGNHLSRAGKKIAVTPPPFPLSATPPSASSASSVASLDTTWPLIL
ncbi:uncharacterized protein An15g05240 [Aspergillus niger]|uniref:Contig An15c0180, genomic contig n=2 Tax=Aspergillus niger TaxID=5061 RepID=A2R5R1_ASPNC|nr:uncharacterized protein An15g05240 [Aspergillus niger]CAK42497.1 unnamed protein product [Aspergillus niger]